MTREETKQKLLSLMPAERFIVIDDIYNDFESRVCGNCKYFYTPEGTESFGLCNKFKTLTESDFGCNRFERREDENI